MCVRWSTSCWAASSTNAEHPYGRERKWNRRPPEPNSPRLFSSFLARLTPAVFRPTLASDRARRSRLRIRRQLPH